jgi:hypothetical protein
MGMTWKLIYWLQNLNSAITAIDGKLFFVSLAVSALHCQTNNNQK